MQVYAHIEPRSPAEVSGLVRRAEQLGFDGIHLRELKVDPFLTSLLAAEHSERLKVGTAVAIAFPRSPMITAGLAWGIQDLSRGRFQLGLGTQVKGHNERRFSVPWSAPGPRLREYILSLRAIWDCWQRGTPLNFRGQHYTFTLMTPEFAPAPIDHPAIPILISAVNPYNLRLAGEVCDGVHLHPLCSAKYFDEVVRPQIEAGATAAGRSLRDLVVDGGGFVVTAPNQTELAKLIAAARQRLAFYASTPSYEPVMALHGWGETARQLQDLARKGQWQEMPRLITDAIYETFTIAGTYDEIAPAIRRRYDGRANQIDLPLPSPDADAEARLQKLIRAVKDP